jgi:hypothetical protein
MNKTNVKILLGIMVTFWGSIVYGSLEISQVNEQADIDHSGNILYAVNFGTGEIQLSGITFYSPASYAGLTYVKTDEGSVLDWLDTYPTLVYPNTGDSDLDSLLGGIIYKTNTPTSPDGSTYVNAPGLEIGHLYQLQIIDYEPFPPPVSRVVDFIVEDTTIASNIETLSLQGGVVGNGGFNLTYSLTATDTVLNFAITPVNNVNTATTGLSAFVLSEIPEPTTFGLFMMGCIIARRRIRHSGVALHSVKNK